MKKIPIELEVHCGWEFTPTAQTAKEMAANLVDNIEGHEASKSGQRLVKFNFNGIDCLVSPATDLALLQRDYHHALCLKWKQIGPDCSPAVSPEIQAQLDAAQAKQDAEWNEIMRNRAAEEARQKLEAIRMTSGIEFDAIDKAEFEKNRESSDAYTNGALKYAIMWAKIMQFEMGQGKALGDIFESSQDNLGYMGITGNMYAHAVHFLAIHWKHGGVVRKIHNDQHGYAGEGTVNSAVFVLK